MSSLQYEHTLARRSRSLNSEVTGLGRDMDLKSLRRRKSAFTGSTGGKRDSAMISPSTVGDEAYLGFLSVEDMFKVSFLNDPKQHDLLFKYCKKERSEENIKLYDEIKEWRNILNKQLSNEKLLHIQSTYMNELSPHEVNMEHNTRAKAAAVIDRIRKGEDVLEKDIKRAVDLLEDAVIKNLMDSYSRFLKSPLYDELTLDEVQLYRETSSVSMLKNMGRMSMNVKSSSSLSDLLTVPRNHPSSPRSPRTYSYVENNNLRSNKKIFLIFLLHPFMFINFLQRSTFVRISYKNSSNEIL